MAVEGESAPAGENPRPNFVVSHKSTILLRRRWRALAGEGEGAALLRGRRERCWLKSQCSQPRCIPEVCSNCPTKYHWLCKLATSKAAEERGDDDMLCHSRRECMPQ